MRVAAALLAVLILAMPSLTARRAVIYSSNISAATAPDYGCDDWRYDAEGVYYTTTLSAGVAPSGNDAVRVTSIPEGGVGQSTFGCRFPGEANVVQGSTRYGRWRAKYITPIMWRSDSMTANARSVLDKTFIIGNTCEDLYGPTRMISYTTAPAPNRDTIYVNMAQGTGPDTDPVNVGADSWLNIQVMAQSSSVPDAADGVISIWVNNDNVASPNATLTGVPINTDGWSTNICAGSHIVWGEGTYAAPTAVAGGNVVQEMADFEYADSFDANWNDPTPAPAGAGVRLRRPDLDWFRRLL